jgi:hypothetical protein
MSINAEKRESNDQAVNRFGGIGHRLGRHGGSCQLYVRESPVKGVGYENVEMIVSTQTGFNGDKLVEKESGSGNVITERPNWRRRGK